MLKLLLISNKYFIFLAKKSKKLDNKIKFNNVLKLWPNLSIFLNEIFIFI